MFEWLMQSVHQYGLIGLFISSLIGSTIFLPFSVELTFPILLKAGIHKLAIIFTSAAGAVCGTLINYRIGYYGIKYAHKHVRKKKLERATKLMNKYGLVGLFTIIVLPLPLPVDPITIICVAARMDINRFTTIFLAAKMLKYALTLGVIAIIL